jgi:5-hydroxyisourate hydrolase
MTKSHITTHVLDAVSGRPAVGVRVTLESTRPDGSWIELDDGATDADGRITRLGPEVVEIGHYRLRFDTGTFFALAGVDTFYPEVVLTFTVSDADAHYHVPLLLSPFAFSTYRGS